jgi:spore germination protein YaaH
VAHQVFGFAPYWMLPQASRSDLSQLTTVAYFSVNVTANGTFEKSGPGWAGYQSSQLADLVTRAHAAGDRVVLTVSCSNQHTLDQLTHAAQAPSRLAQAITQALIAKSMDGVNIDFEGLGSKDRAGLVALVTQLSQELRAVDPAWQITMDTYGSSASDPSGFFDVQGLAPAVDGFFVMAYDMGSRQLVSPTAPLTGAVPNDTQVVTSYLSAVPASKILLGIPLYGYVFPTTGALPGAPATGASFAMTEDQIENESDQVYWDPATQVAWTAWRDGQRWYQTFFDDPASVAAKVSLAAQDGLAGVGVWTLGMGNSQALSALALGGTTKDWSSSAEPPISEADAALADLSPFPDLSSSDLSSAFSDLSYLPDLVGSDFGLGSDSGFGSGPDASGELPNDLGTGNQGAPSATTPGSSAPGGTGAPGTSAGTAAGSTPSSTAPGSTASGSTATTNTAGGNGAGTGSGGSSPGGSGAPPSHLCAVISEVAQMAEALAQPGAPAGQASAVAAAMGASAPGCAESPESFGGASPSLCSLLGGVAQLATLRPAEAAAADSLYESAGCASTVSPAPGAGQVAPSVQGLACALATVADQQGSAALSGWGGWLATVADCSPGQLLASVPGALSPLVDQVPSLAAALGDSTSDACSFASLVGATDQSCASSTSTTTAAAPSPSATSSSPGG